MIDVVVVLLIAAAIAYVTLWITRQIPEVYEILVYLGMFGMTVALALTLSGVR
jgi:hypothetical protein